jgi:hypothetical protein
VHPSLKNSKKVWYPFTAITSNGDSASPTFQQARIGSAPNHLGDICLYGTLCAVPDQNQGGALGNRNMADFISADIGPDGALQITYADDANNVATRPTTLLPGIPVTMSARQVSGPRLRGSGTITSSRFRSTPTTAGIHDASGDALFPVDARAGKQTNVPQLDITSSRIEWDGAGLVVHMTVANATSLASPDALDQTNVWWLTSWKFNNHIYFARAQSNGGAAPTFAAGIVQSYDRPGICLCTSPTLVDYSGGAAVTGKLTGNDMVITVPAAMVGGPKDADVLTGVTATTALDNGKPLFVGPGGGNIPTEVDAAPAYNALLTVAPVGLPEHTGLFAVFVGVIATGYVARRRRGVR